MRTSATHRVRATHRRPPAPPPASFPPAAPTGLTATAAGPAQINLAWTDNSTNENGFVVERAPDSSGSPGTFAVVGGAGTGATTFQNLGLAQNTKYWYRVRAFNAAGFSAYTSNATATTTNPLTIPAAPSSPTATADSSSHIVFSWTNNAVNASSNQVHRSTDGGATYSLVATLAAATTSYGDTGLTPATVYYYKVRSVNAAGNSAFTSPVNATTQDAGGTTGTPGVKPAAGTPLNVSDELYNGLVFCLPCNEGAGATSLIDSVSGAASPADTNMQWGSVPAGTSGVPFSGPYVDNTGPTKANARFDQGGSLLADQIFQALASRTSPATGYTVAWIARAKDGVANDAAYVVDNKGGTGNPLNFGSYLNTPGKPGGTVGETLHDASNASIAGALAEFTFNTTLPVPWIAVVKVMQPGTSGGLKVYANVDVSGNPQATLRQVASWPTADANKTLGAFAIGGMNGLGSWGANTGPAGSPEDMGFFGIWNRPLSVTVDGSLNVTAGEVFDWNASPLRMYGSAGPVPTAPGVPGSVAATSLSDTQISLSWQPSTSNQTGYTAQIATNSGFSTGLQTISPILANATSVTFSGLTASTGYYLRVLASNAIGNSAYCSAVQATTQSAPVANIPGAPTQTVPTVVSDTTIRANWTVADGLATSFVVQYSTSNAFTTPSSLAISNPAATFALVGGLAAATLYYFRVAAVNSSGQSAWSATQSATTQPTSPGAVSPTGRNPRLLWTPARQAIYNQMVAVNNAWWVWIKSSAAVEGTAGARYADIGSFGAIAFQATGDPTYAQKAFAQLQSAGYFGHYPTDPNTVRQYFCEIGVIYDWCYPGWTAQQRQTVIDTLNMWSDWCMGVNQPQYVGDFRTADSDQTTGQYFGLAFVDLATGPDNPRAGTFLSATTMNTGSGSWPVGGLDATTANQNSTIRNCLAYYAGLASGGEWFESTEYNPNTMQIMAMGVEGCRTATGVDHFPEFTALYPAIGLRLIQQIEPALRQLYTWGDEQNPRQASMAVWMFAQVPCCMTFAGILDAQANANAGYVTKLTEQVSHLGNTLDPSSEGQKPRGAAFYFYNPLTTQVDWRGVIPASQYASGQGIVAYHDGWTSGTSAMFGAQMSPRTHCDHEVSFLSDLQLWRKGEWALTHPIGYSGGIITSNAPIRADGVNSMVVAGLGASAVRGPLAQETGTGYCYLAGTTSGQYYDQPYYQTPATYLNEETRSIVYLPAGGSGAQAIVVFDRVDALDPKVLANFANYRAGDLQYINAAPARKTAVWHCPVPPVQSGNLMSWTTAGGQVIEVNTLAPTAPRFFIYDEKQLYKAEIPVSQGGTSSSGSLSSAEALWQFRVAPAVDQQWDTFCTVIGAGDAAGAVTSSLVTSQAGKLQGALVSRSGINTKLVLFGAIANAGNRVLSAGESFTWTGAVDAILCDLDHTKSWTYAVDGGAPAALTVSANNAAVFSVAGAGAHTVVLAAV